MMSFSNSSFQSP